MCVLTLSEAEDMCEVRDVSSSPNNFTYNNWIYEGKSCDFAESHAMMETTIAISN